MSLEVSSKDDKNDPCGTDLDAPYPVQQAAQPNYATTTSYPPQPPPSGYSVESPPPPGYNSDSPQTMVIIPGPRVFFSIAYNNAFYLFNPSEEREPADDYLCLAIFSCIFLNLILGIIAIVFSYKTRKANQREDYETANKNSKTTLYVIIAAAIVGVITAILSLVLGVDKTISQRAVNEPAVDMKSDSSKDVPRVTSDTDTDKDSIRMESTTGG